MVQPFLTYEQQINKLIYDKKLIINDRQYAEQTLRQIGYYALISGYKDLYKNPTTKKYRAGICFEDIVALYKFDENLRELFLKYLLKLERNLRSTLSYYFTEKYGGQQNFYLSANSYNNTSNNNRGISRLIGELNNLACNNSDYPYINHHRSQYNNVPLWVLVNGLSFGTLSKFYQYMTFDLQSKISKNFTSINEKELHQILSVITNFRNVCAHNERLFSYKTKNDIPNLLIHSKLRIPQKGIQYIYGKHDLFAVVIVFRYMLQKSDFIKFKRNFTNTINHFTQNTSAINEADLIEYMGFPSNWKIISRFNKI